MKNHQILSQAGRSMVEMLGVLTIIGLLSVMGMYGYSKAMDKLGLNKQAQQMYDFTTGMLAFTSSNRTSTMTSDQFFSAFVQLGYLPDSLELSTVNSRTYLDYFGNRVILSGINTNAYVDWNFETIEQFVNLAQTIKNFSASISSIEVFSPPKSWYGDKRCQTGYTPCLSNMTLSDWQTYGNENSNIYMFRIWFYLR
jgi:type II secretory pathway pseudopilin PulG